MGQGDTFDLAADKGLPVFQGILQHSGIGGLSRLKYHHPDFSIVIHRLFLSHHGFPGAICQSSYREPLIVTESVRLAQSIPAGVQMSITWVLTV